MGSRNGPTATTVEQDQGPRGRPRWAWSRRRRLLQASSCRSTEIDLRAYVRGIERVIARGAGVRWRPK